MNIKTHMEKPKPITQTGYIKSERFFGIYYTWILIDFIDKKKKKRHVPRAFIFKNK